MKTRILVSLAILTAYGVGYLSARGTTVRGKIDAMTPVVRFADIQVTERGGQVLDGHVSSMQVDGDVAKLDVPEAARTTTPMRLQGTVNERPFLAFVHLTPGKRYGE